MDYVKCGLEGCDVRLLKSSFDGKQYCSQEHRTIDEQQTEIAELKKENHGLKAYNTSLQEKLSWRADHDANVIHKMIEDLNIWGVIEKTLSKYADNLIKPIHKSDCKYGAEHE